MNLIARIRWLSHLCELYRLAETTHLPNYAKHRAELKRLQVQRARQRGRLGS